MEKKLNDQEIQKRQKTKNKIIHFFQGCKNNKCISPDCNNFIVFRKDLEDYRKNKQIGLQYVLKNIKNNQLDIYCVEEEKNLIIDESLKKYESLMRFDFQKLLEQNNDEKKIYLKNIDNLVSEMIKNNDLQFRLRFFIKLDSTLKNSLTQIQKVLAYKPKNFEFFKTLLQFIITFRFVFEIEYFDVFKNFKIFFQQLKFKNLYEKKMKNKFKNDFIIDKITFSSIIENLQNLSALIVCNDPGVPFSKKDIFTLHSIYSIINLFYQLNNLINKQNKHSNKDFQNDNITCGKQLNLEVIQIISNSLQMKQNEQSSMLIELIENDKINKNFNYLDYPFIFSVAQKVDFLRLESRVFQQLELQKFFQNLSQNMFSIFEQDLFLEINIRRNHVLEDALNEIHSKGNNQNLKKNLKIKFVGEPGVDEGGLTKEFFQLITQVLFDPNFGMFVIKNERYLWFNMNSFECRVNFELVGILMGLALYNSTILEVHFPLVIYKKLKSEMGGFYFVKDEITLEDLNEFEPQLYTSFNNLLNTDLSQNEYTGFTFTANYESWGKVEQYELIENGAEVEVTEQNKFLFVEKYLQWYFHDSIKQQFEPFKDGFYKVIHGEIIKKFNAHDVFQAICGSKILNFSELKKTTKYQDGYTQNSLTIKLFWEILEFDFDEIQKQKFLKFLTGSDRAPLRGLSDIKMTILKFGNQQHLPAAHTCFNHLLLPNYQNKNLLKEKLLKAIENCEGFGLLQFILLIYFQFNQIYMNQLSLQI